MLLGKFTQVLSDSYQIRTSEHDDRTEEDFEIISVKRYEPTEFGLQGSLFLWFGKDTPSDSYDSEGDWGASLYFSGFQNFLEFYTAPTKIDGIRKFVLYTPWDDWTQYVSVVIDEIEYAGDPSRDEDEELEDLIVRLLGNKYQLKKVSDDFVKKYID
jgi:hypothetical protein